MTEKMKTGLCAAALLLALLAAYVQETTWQNESPAGTTCQPAPFAATVDVRP